MNNKEYISELNRLKEKSEEQYDKLIIYLSSGAIVLSIGFLDNIIDIKEAQCRIFLIVSWLIQVLTIILVLISFLISKYVMELELKEKDSKSDNWEAINKFLSIIQLVFLFIGLIFLITFIIKNI